MSEICPQKLTLEELLSQPAKEELADLQKALKAWACEKKNHNYFCLKQIVESLELITSKIEKIDARFDELQRKSKERDFL